MSKKSNTKFIVIKAGSDYDCGAPWEEVLGKKIFTERKDAYKALVDSMCEEVGISAEQLNELGYEGTVEGVDYYIPTSETDSVHKCSNGFIRTECDEEIHWNIIELEG